MKKKHAAVRAALIFLGIMAAVTFFSRTLRYAMIPKVEVAYAVGGTLKWNCQSDQLQLKSTGRMRIHPAWDEGELRVEEILVQEGDAVSPGDGLLRFEAQTGESALTAAEASFQTAQRELDAWDAAYAQELDALDQEISTLKEELRTTTHNQRRLTEKIAEARARREKWAQAAEVDGVPRTEKEQNLARARENVQALANLRDNQWTLSADIAAFVGEISVSAGEICDGKLPLLMLEVRDGGLLVGIQTELSAENLVDKTVKLDTSEKETARQMEGWEYDGYTLEKGRAILWAHRTAGDTPENTPTALAFLVESPRYQYLVPNSAIAGENLYVLRTRTGAFGGEETYAAQVSLKNPVSDARYTAVESGVGGMDQVIVGWDRAFQDEDAVIVPYE